MNLLLTLFDYCQSMDGVYCIILAIAIDLGIDWVSIGVAQSDSVTVQFDRGQRL